MRTKNCIFTLAAILIVAAGASRAIEAATELARINNQVITLEDFNKKYQDNLKFFQARPPTRRNMLDDLIKRELSVQEAKREGLDRDPEVIDQMNTVLYHALLNKKLAKDFEQIHVTDDEAKAFYAKNPELRTSQIFVAVPPNPSAEEAKRASAKIREIYDDYVRDGKMGFASVAQQYSEGPSAPMGGDMDYQTRDKLDPTYYETALHLKKGQISAPVRSQYGWHIIKLTDIKPWSDTDHGLAKRLLIEQRRNELFEKYVAQLRAKSRVTVHNELLKD